MSLETLYYRKLGIRKEFPELNPVSAGLLTLASLRYTRKHHTIIEGCLPKEGAAILTGNHFQESDSYKIIQASRMTAGRLASRAVVRKSLVYRNSQESEEYLRSIGDKRDNLNRYNSLRAFVLRGVGVISIMRDNPGLDFVRQGDAVLKSGQLLGIYIQPTRDGECLLKMLQAGAAFFARRYPLIPVYPIASSGPPYGPDKVHIFEPITYAEKSKEAGRRLTVGEFTIILADIIAGGLPESSQTDWQTRRSEELTRLTSP